MQVGTTKDYGLYNKPSDAVHPGVISRRDPTTMQYNTWKASTDKRTFMSKNKCIFNRR